MTMQHQGCVTPTAPHPHPFLSLPRARTTQQHGCVIHTTRHMRPSVFPRLRESFVRRLLVKAYR